MLNQCWVITIQIIILNWLILYFQSYRMNTNNYRYMQRIDKIIGLNAKSPSPYRPSKSPIKLKTSNLDCYLKFELSVKIISSFIDKNNNHLIANFFNALRTSKYRQKERIYKFVAIEKVHTTMTAMKVDSSISAKILISIFKQITKRLTHDTFMKIELFSRPKILTPAKKNKVEIKSIEGKTGADRNKIKEQMPKQSQKMMENQKILQQSKRINQQFKSKLQSYKTFASTCLKGQADIIQKYLSLLHHSQNFQPPSQALINEKNRKRSERMTIEDEEKKKLENLLIEKAKSYKNEILALQQSINRLLHLE